MEDMTQEDKQEFKEYIFSAIQATKQENSNLVGDLKDRFLGAIREEIKITVNGKIDGIKMHLENQDKERENIFKILEKIQLEQKTVSENLGKTQSDLKISQVKFWTAVSVVIFLGGTIITLAIMAIDSKIKDGISAALVNYEQVNEQNNQTKK